MKILAILLISLLAFPVAAQQYWQGKDRAYYQEKQDRQFEQHNDRIERQRVREGYPIYRGNPDAYHPRRDRRANRSFNGLSKWLRY
jgi:hypothetical protein